jgi:hypothetical protein
VPQTAVIPTDQGFVGFVLKGEDQVERRLLKLGLYTREGSVEVVEGLAIGDRLVTRGAASLSESSRVVVTSAPEDEAAGAGGPGSRIELRGPGRDVRDVRSGRRRRTMTLSDLSIRNPSSPGC